MLEIIPFGMVKAVLGAAVDKLSRSGNFYH